MPNDAYEFLLERHPELAATLRQNPDVSALLQGVLDHLIDRATERGQLLSSVVIESPEIIYEGTHAYLRAGVR